jgi:hypothetical protein
MPPVVSQEHKDVSALPETKNSNRGVKSWVLIMIVVAAGLGTGYMMAKPASGSPTAAPGVKTSGNEIGIQDEKTFRDCAEGIIETNDARATKTEGSHKLIREGGPSKTLYMTSSVLALDEYQGKKVEVCGETLQSKKVAWFMDIGRLKLLE